MPEIDPLTIDVVRKLINHDNPLRPDENGKNGWCLQHTGHESRIKNLEELNGGIMGDIKKTDNRVNGMIGRLNVILGGIVVACVMLAINMVLGFVRIPH